MTISIAPIVGAPNEEMVPRFRQAGDVSLDLIYRDGRVGDRWLGLHPREFELLWRLSEQPNVPVSRLQLLTDVWRINHDPQTNSVAVHVARVRGKLGQFGLSHLVATHPNEGYYLDVPVPTATIGPRN